MIPAQFLQNLISDCLGDMVSVADIVRGWREVHVVDSAGGQHTVRIWRMPADVACKAMKDYARMQDPLTMIRPALPPQRTNDELFNRLTPFSLIKLVSVSFALTFGPDALRKAIEQQTLKFPFGTN